MNPIFYIPLITLVQFFVMYASFKSNSIYAGGGYKWLLMNILIGCLSAPLWAIIAYYSKNMVLDSVLYDITVAVSCVSFALYFSGKYFFNFSTMEVIGIFIMLFGLLVFKFSEL